MIHMVGALRHLRQVMQLSSFIKHVLYSCRIVLQFTLPFEDGADLNYIYPQALAKQLAPYNNTSAWANHDIVIEINHDAYMNTVNYDQAISNGWNGIGVPPGGTYYFKVTRG